jgi:hypothetical protein
MPLDREYWESLDVCLEDIIDDEKRLSDVQEHLANKLEDVFGNCNSLVKEYYNAKGSQLYSTVSYLFIHSKDDFRELYALAKYSENKLNFQYIEKMADRHLKGMLPKRIIQQTQSERSLLLPLFKANPDTLYDIHYSHILQSRIAKQYSIARPLDEPIPFKNLDKSEIDAILRELEEKSKAKFKLQTKVWRYKPTKNSALIVFRKEKKLRSRVSKVDRNEYHKTGAQKIISFKDSGNILQVSSKDKKPLRSLNTLSTS